VWTVEGGKEFYLIACGGEAGPLYFSPIYSSEPSIWLVSPAAATRGMLRSLQHSTNEFEEHGINKYYV